MEVLTKDEILSEEVIANVSTEDTEETTTAEEAVAEAEAAIDTEDKFILPFDYAEDEHYFVEQLGEIPKKPFYSFCKRAMDMGRTDRCSVGFTRH